jgi:hypothetical protein
MKKLLYSLAVLVSLVFTACDPSEKFTENTAANISGDEISATLVQENGDNLVKVTVHSAGTAQISNGKQTIKANYADLIMRELGPNTVYVKVLNAKGEVVEKQYPVNVTNMKYPLPVLETIVWQGEAAQGGTWNGTLRFCVGKTTEGILPWLDDDTYDWMAGKLMSLDIKEATPGSTLRVTTGWWDGGHQYDYKIESAPCKIQFPISKEFADLCKVQHLLFTGDGNITITKFYYEL